MKFTHEETDAKRISAVYKHEENCLVNAEQTNETTGYALSWLHLTNNAREFPHVFYDFSNNSGNGIDVVCSADESENVKEYLSELGFVPYCDEDCKRVSIEVWATARDDSEDYLDYACFCVNE